MSLGLGTTLAVVGWRPSFRDMGWRVRNRHSLARATGLREFLSFWRRENLAGELGKEEMRRATPPTVGGWDPQYRAKPFS